MKGAMTDREELLAFVAHELRGPLTAIAGWTDLLEREELSFQGRRAVEIIRRNAMTQSRLIEDLLDRSRIAKGALRITCETVDVWALATELVDGVRPAADERNIEIRVNGAGPAAVHADPERLRQVLHNLLANALHYSPKRSRVELEIVRAEDQLLIRVRDSGIGIAPTFLPYVFEQFRRERRSPASGMGLGLAIAREIVELHGGSISVESAGEGRGATFTVALPSLDARVTRKSA